MKRIFLLSTLFFMFFLFCTQGVVAQNIIQVGTNTPAYKSGYAVMEIYGVGANGSGSLIDEEGTTSPIYNYTGYIGGSFYFYIKPGVYTVESIGTSGKYVYIMINGVKKLLVAGSSFTIPNTGSSVSIVFSTQNM